MDNRCGVLGVAICVHGITHRTRYGAYSSKTIGLTSQIIAHKSTVRHPHAINAVLVDGIVGRNTVDHRFYKAYIVNGGSKHISKIPKTYPEKFGPIGIGHN